MRWQKLQDCPPAQDCDCPEPVDAPSYVGQIVVTPCGGSDSGSSSSSSEPPLTGCESCGNVSCTCTAGTSLWVPGIIWDCPDDGCNDTPGQEHCRCRYPNRSPDFSGDVETSICDCCKGCQWTWYGPWGGSYWGEVSGNGNGCVYVSCDPCGTGPDWTPSDNLAVVAACGVDLSGGGSDSESS